MIKKIINLMKVYGVRAIILIFIIDLIMKCDDFFMIDFHALLSRLVDLLDKWMK
jgi:hypothetical protein